MNPSFFPGRGCGNGLLQQADIPAKSEEMPASVLEPLQSSREDVTSTNPFDDYEGDPSASSHISQAKASSTAFAATGDSGSRGGHMRNAASSVLYPEGLPRFLGVLQPTVSFGLYRSTLSRGMDFIAHFVALTTLLSFFATILAISWMQKLCLPIAKQWNSNYTLVFGAFMALLAVFSWRSATNFDLRRSKFFLFLLGWRLHALLLLSLLMILSLAFKPQFNAHVQNSVRSCMLASNSAESSSFRLSPSSASLLQSVQLSGLQASDALLRASAMPSITEEGLGTPGFSAKGVQSAYPVVVSEKATDAEPTGQSADVKKVVKPSPLTPAGKLASQQEVASPAVSGQEPELLAEGGGKSFTGGTDSNQPIAVDSSSSPPSQPESGQEEGEARVADEGVSGTAISAEQQESPAAGVLTPSGDGTVVGKVPEVKDARNAPEQGSPLQADTATAPPDSSAHQDEAPDSTAAAASSEEAQAGHEAADQKPAQTLELEKQRARLEAAQHAAVQEANAFVLVALVVASFALVFELYLMYACWSFKVWMERGYESVVLAGVAPFATADAGDGWLAYAVRMPQSVQMETYGADAGRPGRLPLFLQTTDSFDGFAHFGLPMTGRW
ncbi:uncharacterized protein LOC34623839 [Cyclospora cayetanensis]|uniref:Uncharacterized protein LOC34623839 n=1 Tax=Cyclospora cayetanensis TaxID=88456 RepID=A0A6P6RQW1_9EIME|nr:uncharacterized protein LOC34623839 [Cyclospora cayetanensis]